MSTQNSHTVNYHIIYTEERTIYTQTFFILSVYISKYTESINLFLHISYHIL